MHITVMMKMLANFPARLQMTCGSVVYLMRIFSCQVSISATVKLFSLTPFCEQTNEQFYSYSVIHSVKYV